MLITRKQLADKLGVDPQTIRNYEKQGMPVIHLGKNTRPKPRYNYDEIIEWTARNGKVRR